MRLVQRHTSIVRDAPAWVALGIGLAFVATTALAYTLTTVLGGLIALLGAWAFYPLLCCFLMWTVIHAVTHVRRHGAKACVPGYIGAATLLCVLAISSTDVGLSIDFSLNRAQREAVVAHVQAGVLRPNVSY